MSVVPPPKRWADIGLADICIQLKFTKIINQLSALKESVSFTPAGLRSSRGGTYAGDVTFRRFVRGYLSKSV